MELPKCVHAKRVGLGESEYDSQGMLAPITWLCDCGSVQVLETYDWEEDYYVQIPQSRLDTFLAKHQT